MKSKLPIILVAIVLIAAVAVVLFVFVLGGDKEAPIVRTEFVPGDYFVVNVKPPSSRLLKTTIVLVVNTDELDDFLKERTAEIRDTITTVLRSQDEEALRALDHSRLKEEIRAAINEKLEIENITDILITDFAVQ